MCCLPEKRAAINEPENMALICNACNMEIKHGMQIIVRRKKLIHMGQQEMLRQGKLPGYESDEYLTTIGLERVQAWIDSMVMVTGFNAKEMADL